MSTFLFSWSIARLQAALSGSCFSDVAVSQFRIRNSVLVVQHRIYPVPFVLAARFVESRDKEDKHFGTQTDHQKDIVIRCVHDFHHGAQNYQTSSPAVAYIIKVLSGSAG